MQVATFFALTLLLWSPTVRAQDSAPSSTPKVEVDVRADHIQGQTIRTRLTISNPNNAPLSVPNLAMQPERVKFTVQDGEGASQIRTTLSNPAHSTSSWTIPGGGQRELDLDLPGSSGLASGTYQLTIAVDFGTGEATTVGPHALRFERAKPVAGHTSHDGPTVEKVGHQAIWVHQGEHASSVYLHHAEGGDPRNTTGIYFLTEASAQAQPILAHALPSQAWARHIYWLEGQRTIRYVQLEGPGQNTTLKGFDAPWPEISLLGPGVTDRAGGLHIPLWVPSPRRTNGEVKVLTLRPREQPVFHTVARFKEQVNHTATAVDGSGNLRLVIQHGPHADLYTLNTASKLGLPLAGRRLLTLDDKKTEIAGLQFGQLPKRPGHRGGHALFVVERRQVDGEPDQLHSRWISYSGEVLTTLAPQPMKETAEFVDILPIGQQHFIALLGQQRQKDGQYNKLSILEAGQSAVTLQSVGLSPALLADTQGAIWLQSFVDGTGVQQQQISGAPR